MRSLVTSGNRFAGWDWFVNHVYQTNATFKKGAELRRMGEATEFSLYSEQSLSGDPMPADTGEAIKTIRHLDSVKAGITTYMQAQGVKIDEPAAKNDIRRFLEDNYSPGEHRFCTTQAAAQT
jgi:hypothetical protein